MLDKLQKVEEHFSEIESRLSDPSIVADVEKFTALTREHATLEPIVKKFREYKKILAQIDEDKTLLETSTDDDSLAELDEAAALKNISTMPARVKCATLAWHTLDTAVTQQ